MLRTWVTRSGDRRLTSPLAERLLLASQQWRQRGRDARSPDHGDRGGDPRPASALPSCPPLPTTTSTPTATPRRRSGWRRSSGPTCGASTGSACWSRRASCPTTRSSTTRSPSTSVSPGSTPTPASYETEDLLLQPQRRAGAARVRPRRHVLRRRPPDQDRRRRPRRRRRGDPQLGVLPVLRLRRRRHRTRPGPRPAPAATSTGIADVDQRFDVVELTQVSSTMRRDEAVDRRRPRRTGHASASTRSSAADVDPAEHHRAVVRRGLRLRRQAPEGPDDPVAQPRPDRGPRLDPLPRRARRSMPRSSGSARRAGSSTAAPVATPRRAPALVPAAQRRRGGHPLGSRCRAAS